jgi:threonine/homoserine/homoserine lactone efflux protein
VIESMLAFAAVAAIVTVTPGLDSVLVLRTAAASGRRAALTAGAGINLGCFLWAAASGLGVTAVLTASELAYDVLRWAGAAYLCWLGVRALLAARRHRTAEGAEAPAAAGRAPAAQRPLATFRTGLLTNLLNPKIGAFYVAIIPQFVPADVDPLLAALVMALIHNVEGMLWFAVLVLVVRRAGEAVNRPAVRRRFDQVAGLCFIGFGVRLAAEAR